MIRRPTRSTLSSSSAASDVYKRQGEQAVGLAQAQRSCADPNPSFREQLEQWAVLGADLEGSTPAHAAARANAARRSHNKNMLWLDCEPTQISGSSTRHCAKCNLPLFGDLNVVRGGAAPTVPDLSRRPSHMSRRNSVESKKLNRKGSKAGRHPSPPPGEGNSSSVDDGAIAVEPLAWMNTSGALSNLPSGKLNCPECNAKLGSWSWDELAGLKPAFLLRKERLR
eukprot:TRINITY_DN53153_c0_g1_i1.p1 TRINITY_DN53153_c0_g1~~TRINITY_DN53153_c0_g1_i1.p1  ORF type:complete len:225 (+),score=34.96 TRINITY_DN53153_c0_g1_i1:64-738(+)